MLTTASEDSWPLPQLLCSCGGLIQFSSSTNSSEEDHSMLISKSLMKRARNTPKSKLSSIITGVIQDIKLGLHLTRLMPLISGLVSLDLSHGWSETLSTGQLMESIFWSFHSPSPGKFLLHGKKVILNLHSFGGPVLLKLVFMDQCQKVSTPTDSKFHKQSQSSRLKKKKNAREEDADRISSSLNTKLKQTLNLKKCHIFKRILIVFTSIDRKSVV